LLGLSFGIVGLKLQVLFGTKITVIVITVCRRIGVTAFPHLKEKYDALILYRPSEVLRERFDSKIIERNSVQTNETDFDFSTITFKIVYRNHNPLENDFFNDNQTNDSKNTKL